MKYMLCRPHLMWEKGRKKKIPKHTYSRFIPKRAADLCY
jgi:hypothetical protein